MPSREFQQSLEAQNQLLEDSLPLVFDAYDDARRGGVSDPVVFLLDCEDEMAGQIARSWLGDGRVDDAIADQHATAAPPDHADQSLTTVFAVAFPLEECRREVPEVFPYLAPALRQNPPQDGFFAISIAAGGASIFTIPHSARPQ